MVEAPIFVVGAPRTGTTLMKDILNRHPSVYLFNEVHFCERIWDARAELGTLEDEAGLRLACQRLRDIVARHGTDAAAAEAFDVDHWLERAREAGGGYRGLLAALLRMTAEQHGAERWGDSSPQDVLYLPTLFGWYPQARVVAMVRDPRAFLSSYKHYHRRAMDSYRERYNPLTVSLLWRSYMSALAEARGGPHAEAIRVQSYEQLVDEPEQAVAGVCEHVGVDFRPALLEVERANSSYARGRGGAGISNASRDRWRESLEPTEQWLVERLCAPVMRSLGYVPDGGLRPSPVGLARALAMVPGRLFNMLFRGRKEFRIAKVRRVLGSLRGNAPQ